MFMTIAFALEVRLASKVILPSSVNLMAFKNTQETSFAKSRSSTMVGAVSLAFGGELVVTYQILSPVPGDLRTIQ